MTQNTKTAYFAVDVQNDFCEGGALGVRGGTQVADAIASHLRLYSNEYDAIVASRDWHIDPGTHWAPEGEEPNFVTTWPVHCAANTPGANYKQALADFLNSRVRNQNIEVLKGQYEDAYSAFMGKTLDGEHIGDVLRAQGITTLVLGGIATDHCVKATALDALNEGFEVIVRLDHVAGVDDTASVAALAEVELAGGEIRGTMGTIKIGTN